MQTIQGFYFNGQDSRKLEVTLSLQDNTLEVKAPNLDTIKLYQKSQFKVPPPLGSVARVIEFSDGARFESFDYSSFDLMFPQQKHQSFIYNMENSLVYATVACAIGLMILLLTHFYLIPWSANTLARRTPKPVLSILQNSTLKTISLTWRMNPSDIDAKTYPEVHAKALKLTERFPDLDLQVQMISSGPMAKLPNAFALPAGKILITESLIKLMSADEIYAILLHEAGHVHHRHSLKALIKSTGLYAVLSLAFGVTDFGSLTLTLINAAYSRDDERQADDFSAKQLVESSMNPMLLADGLTKIQKKQHSKDLEKMVGILSTHPMTDERTQRLKNMAIKHGFTVLEEQK